MSADTRSGLYFGVGKSGFNGGFEMNIETARMVIRDFTKNDINDMQMDYLPAIIQRMLFQERYY